MRCDCFLQNTDFDELEKMSNTFNELLNYLKIIFNYCDQFKEIKTKREQICHQENELEDFIDVLQMLSIQRNQINEDLANACEQQTNELAANVTHNCHLQETNKRLVSIEQ